MYNRKHHLHFIGIGGVGMAGIAEVLLNLGYSVSGSDIKPNRLIDHLLRLGARVSIGHAPENVPEETKVVVLSSAIRPDNSEVAEAERRKLSIIPRAEMLAELMRMKYGVAVAGSHGKTSTTSMIAKILADASLDPTVILGGRVITDTSGARVGTGEYLVAESDESDGSFCLLRPAIAVVTNIDSEHLGHYGSFGALEAAFQNFMSAVPFYGLVIGCFDDPVVRKLCGSIKRRIRSFGVAPEHDLVASDIRIEGLHSMYRLSVSGHGHGIVRLPLAGVHMVSNSLAAVAVGLELEIPLEKIIESLATFPGVSRRTEVLFESPELMVIDDYAHHPREIAATLRAIRQGLVERSQSAEKRRIVTVFQPHRYSRTRELFTDFLPCFADTDRLFVTDIYPAGEEPLPGITGERLASSVTHPDVRFVPQLEECTELLEQEVRSGDVVVFLGAGSVSGAAHRFAERIQSTTDETGQRTTYSRERRVQGG